MKYYFVDIDIIGGTRCKTIKKLFKSFESAVDYCESLGFVKNEDTADQAIWSSWMEDDSQGAPPGFFDEDYAHIYELELED